MKKTTTLACLLLGASVLSSVANAEDYAFKYTFAPNKTNLASGQIGAEVDVFYMDGKNAPLNYEKVQGNTTSDAGSVTFGTGFTKVTMPNVNVGSSSENLGMSIDFSPENPDFTYTIQGLTCTLGLYDVDGVLLKSSDVDADRLYTLDFSLNIYSKGEVLGQAGGSWTFDLGATSYTLKIVQTLPANNDGSNFQWNGDLLMGDGGEDFTVEFVFGNGGTDDYVAYAKLESLSLDGIAYEKTQPPAPVEPEVPSEESVPEPTTATLSLLALAGLAARRRRK